jgi:NADH:ubiquinone oxidoreductase subunit F (NADH-binding)
VSRQLLAGPDLASGPEPLTSHVRRLGPLPRTGSDFVETLARSGLGGRGGSSFPVGAKWRSIARAGGAPVVVVNGAEGEPQSLKDQVLMSTRPHLILDGALVAARTLRASQIVVVVGAHLGASQAVVARALGQRPEPELRSARMIAAPHRYVAGESSAVVNLVNASIALPTSKPPHSHEAGVGGTPTLVQNVETLAHVALVARGGTGRTLLVTVTGGVARPGVTEVETGTTVREALEMAGGATGLPRAVLLGGYFGAWVDAAVALDLPLDANALVARGLSLGCGVVGVLPETSCGVCETARIMRYLASESSAQCGPCFFGLRALADACARIAEHGSNHEDLARLGRWATEVYGRGACRHPDGAVIFMRSALTTFKEEFAKHEPHGAQSLARASKVA